jgi:hypothetical protein
MILSSYSEGSILKRCAINAYLIKNCYIQKLQAVNKQASTAATANKDASYGMRSIGYTINSVTQADLNSMKADMTMPNNSFLKSLQPLVKVLSELDGAGKLRLCCIAVVALPVAWFVIESLIWLYM